MLSYKSLMPLQHQRVIIPNLMYMHGSQFKLIFLIPPCLSAGMSSSVQSFTNAEDSEKWSDIRILKR